MPGFPDRHLAQIVSQRLARPRDVAIDFGFYLVVGKRCVLVQILLCLLACPSLGVNARIYHQSSGTPSLITQHPERFVRCVINSHLTSQALAVKAPALSERRDAHATKWRHILVFLVYRT